MLKQLVSRENGSSDVDLSVRVQHALVEVDVCVAPEPLGLHEGSSRVCRMVVACPVVGTVAAGCAWARFTAFPVSLQSDQFFSRTAVVYSRTAVLGYGCNSYLAAQRVHRIHGHRLHLVTMSS